MWNKVKYTVRKQNIGTTVEKLNGGLRIKKTEVAIMLTN